MIDKILCSGSEMRRLSITNPMLMAEKYRELRIMFEDLRKERDNLIVELKRQQCFGPGKATCEDCGAVVVKS